MLNVNKLIEVTKSFTFYVFIVEYHVPYEWSEVHETYWEWEDACLYIFENIKDNKGGAARCKETKKDTWKISTTDDKYTPYYTIRKTKVK